MIIYRWLVEEHTRDASRNDTTITFHIIEDAVTPEIAFNKAERISSKYRSLDFIFSESELRMVVPNYLWIADSGSATWYEVRRIEEKEL